MNDIGEIIEYIQKIDGKVEGDNYHDIRRAKQEIENDSILEFIEELMWICYKDEKTVDDDVLQTIEESYRIKKIDGSIGVNMVNL